MSQNDFLEFLLQRKLSLNFFSCIVAQVQCSELRLHTCVLKVRLLQILLNNEREILTLCEAKFLTLKEITQHNITSLLNVT